MGLREDQKRAALQWEEKTSTAQGGKGILAGLDIGGTNTRVVLADAEGNCLFHKSYPFGNRNPAGVNRALEAALVEAGGFEPADILSLAAGLAGLGDELPQAAVDGLFQIPGLTQNRTIVNDAIIAHRAAFGYGAGVLVIAGTGSIVFSVYPNGVHKKQDPEAGGIHLADETRTAIEVTEAAAKGDQEAQKVCDAAVGRIVQTVRALAPPGIKGVALVGSVATKSPYLSPKLREDLGAEFEVFEPNFPPEYTALLLAGEVVHRQAVEEGLSKNIPK